MILLVKSLEIFNFGLYYKRQTHLMTVILTETIIRPEQLNSTVKFK